MYLHAGATTKTIRPLFWCKLGNKMLKISPAHCFYPRSILTSTACDCLHREKGGAGSERGVSLLFLTCILIGHLTRSTGRKEKLQTGVREPEEDGPAPPSFLIKLAHCSDAGFSSTNGCANGLQGGA